MRKYTQFATRSIKALLTKLVKEESHEVYRTTMSKLGGQLGTLLITQIKKNEKALLICSNEDADFLAGGLLQRLQKQGINNVSVACFWNDRQKLPTGSDVAPIIRSYIEPTEGVDVFIVVKSIISSACIIKTNISELVYKQSPSKIYVVAPVVLTGAQPNLEAEFELSISKRFVYFWFAEDDERRENGEVVPGIGGSVYERLGIGTSQTKNRYVPELIKKRRAELAKPSLP